MSQGRVTMASNTQTMSKNSEASRDTSFNVDHSFTLAVLRKNCTLSMFKSPCTPPSFFASSPPAPYQSAHMQFCLHLIQAPLQRPEETGLFTQGILHPPLYVAWQAQMGSTKPPHSHIGDITTCLPLEIWSGVKRSIIIKRCSLQNPKPPIHPLQECYLTTPTSTPDFREALFCTYFCKITDHAE